MMLNLAWRNIWRQRSRSLVTAVVVAFIVAFTLFYFGLLEAMKNGSFQRITETSGHLSVRAPNYRDTREFYALLIPGSEAKRATLQAAFADAEVKAMLEVPALLLGEERSRGVQLLGVASPGAERTRFAEDYLAAGRLPAPDALEEIALGKALATALEVDLGDLTYALAPGTEGTGAAAYEVVGLLDLPEQSLEGRYAYVSLFAAQDLAAPAAATHLQVYLPTLRQLTDEGQLTPLKAEIASALGEGLSVETWREANPALASYLNLLDPVILIFDVLFFALAGLLVVNTIYLSVLERVREFGVIISVGASRARVIGMVLMESLILVSSGSLIGFASGLTIVWQLSKGFSLPGAESYAEFGMPLVMYASISLEQILITLAFAVGTALVAALYPAWKAGRLQPVEAMRFAA